MPQYFVKTDLLPQKRFFIKDQDFLHLKTVRRIAEGDQINVRDSGNSLFECVVLEILSDSILMKAVNQIKDTIEMTEVILAAALLKNKNFEFVLQKATEIGISGIQPIVTERTIVQIEHKKESKNSRWSTIIEEASKQSLRPDIPALYESCSFNEFLNKYCEYERFIAHLDDAAPSIRSAVKASSRDKFIIAIGPEGGFSPVEIEKAVKAGWKCIHYGYTQMKAETASIVISSILINEILEKKIGVL